MASQPSPAQEQIIVGKDGYVYAGGVRLCKLIPERGAVQFLDRDRRRSTLRGSQVVEVKLDDLAKISSKK